MNLQRLPNRASVAGYTPVCTPTSGPWLESPRTKATVIVKDAVIDQRFFLFYR